MAPGVGYVAACGPIRWAGKRPDRWLHVWYVDPLGRRSHRHRQVSGHCVLKTGDHAYNSLGHIFAYVSTQRQADAEPLWVESFKRATPKWMDAERLLLVWHAESDRCPEGCEVRWSEEGFEGDFHLLEHADPGDEERLFKVTQYDSREPCYPEARRATMQDLAEDLADAA